MLPNARPVSTIFPSLFGSCFTFFIRPANLCPQPVTVHTARSNPSRPLSQAAGRAAQQWERHRAAHTKERRIRRQERLDQYNEEYRLCEQQGLSPPPALVNLSSDVKESDGEQTTSDRWEPAPPSPRADVAAMESTVEVGAEPPVTGSSVEVSAGTAEAPVGAVDVPPAHEEDEAGVLQLEVNSASSCMPLMLRHIRSSPPFISLSGRRRTSPTLRLSRRSS
jgi:hypothetical protein